MSKVDVLFADAMLSPCGKYRYWLQRVWDEARPACAWIMLNPSTADHTKDDPTIRRVMAFSDAFGFGACNVYNLFAYRSPDPIAMQVSTDPIGPDNDAYLGQIPDTTTIIAAWGVHGISGGRDERVKEMFGGQLQCLGHTKAGHPKHPLYVPNGTKLRALQKGATDER